MDGNNVFHNTSLRAYDIKIIEAALGASKPDEQKINLKTVHFAVLLKCSLLLCFDQTLFCCDYCVFKI